MLPHERMNLIVTLDNYEITSCEYTDLDIWYDLYHI